MSVPSLEEVEIDEELYMTIKMVSTLKKARQISTDVIFIYNLPCRFIAKLTRKNNKKYLGVFVTCNEGSDDESTVCRCWLEFFVLHRKDSSKHYTKRKGCLFKKDARIHGFEDFLAWEEVIRPENEYIVKNEIRLRVNIEMVKPRTYSYFSEELSTGYCDLSNSLLTPKRSEVLFRFRIDNIMKTVREFSPTFYVQNMPWKIMAVLHESKTENEKDTEKKLGVFLRCYGLKGIESWACYAHVTIYIWNHNLNKEPFRRIFNHLYHRDAADYGIYSLLSNERLTNENLGYVNKGSLVIEVEIDTEKPIIIHKRQPVEGPFMINNFVIPDILAHLYTLEDH